MAAMPAPVPSSSEPLIGLAAHFLRLLEVVHCLRAPQGCPWDREQTPQSLIPYLLEEAYEVIESLHDGNPQALKEELGDLLLHIVLQCRMAQERGQFTLLDCLQALTRKLMARHPHVFGEQTVSGSAEVRQHWEVAKQQEKGRASLLDGVPRTLPALTRAQRIQEKAAAVGFDWQTITPVWEKIQEELAELRAACAAADTAAVEEEFGDVLFSLVNLGRFLPCNAEEALRKAIDKFTGRFHGIEQELARRGRRFDEVTLAELDDIWNRFRRK